MMMMMSWMMMMRMSWMMSYLTVLEASLDTKAASISSMGIMLNDSFVTAYMTVL